MPLTKIKGPEREHSYSPSGPNESDIVNKQSGGEKLKYILKFYIGGDIVQWRFSCVYDSTMFEAEYIENC